LPTGSPIVVNWDMYVVQFPWFNGLTMLGTTRVNNVLYPGVATSPANTIGLGGICVWIVASGAPLNIQVAPTFQLNLPSAYQNGGCRVIGSAFEVINTTATNFVQGQACVWRQSNGDISAQTDFLAAYGNVGNGAAALILPFTGQMIPAPPQSFANAMLIPGTRQWKAEQGCYVVSPHISEVNPQILASYTQPVMFLGPNSDGVLNTPSVPTGLPPGNNQTNLLMPAFGNGTQAGTYFAQATRIFPLHQTGAIFTGLSATSTLTLTWNVYLERFPTVAEPEILVLATPSASMDYIALRAYSEALLSLPVGVPAGENGLGDWFAGVVQKVTNWLTPAAKAAGFTTISGISKLAGQAAGAYLGPPSPMVPPPLPPPNQVVVRRRPGPIAGSNPAQMQRRAVAVRNAAADAAYLAKINRKEKKAKKRNRVKSN